QEACKEGHANHVSFNATITACERGSRWTLALQLLQEMRSRGVVPDTGSYGALLTALGRGSGPWQQAVWLLEKALEVRRQERTAMSLKELMERALTPIWTSGRLAEALMIYRQGKDAGVWPGDRGSRLLDLHDFAGESAQVAVCAQLLQLAKEGAGEVVIVTGRGGHSREGGVTLHPLLTHFLQELKIPVRPDPKIAGRLRVSLPEDFYGVK
ncbi:unnamed protein product, partial [Cladocopium goreaui]